MHLPRWLIAALCAAPLLAQAQSNCASPNADGADGDYILGTTGSTASAMHWESGLVWNRCVEGVAFDGTGQCMGTVMTKG